MTDVGQPVLVRATAIEIARGTVLAGRYQVEAVIGRGGSGIVLRAFDRVAQVPVAVKLLKPDLAADPRWIERFSRELRLARQIQHANVCRVFDIGQADGHWFITMELATAGTLRGHLGAAGLKRSFDERVEDARAVVAGLAAIHEAGIVHRDLKPDNFLRMADGRLVLSDFGLATIPSDGSMVSVMVGTPAYMAPEVVLGDQSSLRSDVWSLGVVLHEIFFNVRPERTSFAAKSRIQALPARKLTVAERSVASFIEGCLREDPAQRPADGGAARRGFEQAISSKAIAGWSRRRRAAWTWPALAAAAAVAVGVGTGHWWRGATASSTDAQATVPAVVRGEAKDWTNTSSIVASFDEPIHCLSWLEPDRVLEIVLGKQRRAITLDVTTKMAAPSVLAEQTYELGCPQRSSRGGLLFESFDQTGRRQIMLAPSAERVAEAKAITSGLQPVWFPSGKEFAYTADDSHAAVFSLPVMTTTIVNERSDDVGMLVGKSISPDGSSIALRYVDQSMRWHVVFHELPTLSTSSHVVFDDMATEIEFTGNQADRLVLSLAGQSGAVLASLDPLTGFVDRLGTIPAHDLGHPTRGHDTFALTDVLMRSDVWRVENGVRTVRLTTDGQSYRPDVSLRGDLIVQHEGIDGNSAIQLREKGRAPRAVSSGPRDYTPSFLPDGNGWLYVDGTRRTIRRCDLAGSCRDVYTSSNDDLPVQPVASPDLSQIAFVTAIGRERLKVVSNDGKARDLGPARADCAPRWAPGNHIWVLQGAERELSWAEIDVTTGELLRTLPITADALRSEGDCPVLTSPPAAFRPREAASWSSKLSVIRIVSAQQPVPLGQKP